MSINYDKDLDQKMKIKRILVIAALLSSGFASNAVADFPNASAQMAAVLKARAAMLTAQAELIKSQASLITARAEARKTYFEAMAARQQVQGAAMDNQLKFASTHYAKKQVRASYIANKNRRRPRPTSSPHVGRFEQAVATVARYPIQAPK